MHHLIDDTQKKLGKKQKHLRPMMVVFCNLLRQRCAKSLKYIVAAHKSGNARYVDNCMRDNSMRLAYDRHNGGIVVNNNMESVSSFVRTRAGLLYADMKTPYGPARMPFGGRDATSGGLEKDHHMAYPITRVFNRLTIRHEKNEEKVIAPKASLVDGKCTFHITADAILSIFEELQTKVVDPIRDLLFLRFEAVFLQTAENSGESITSVSREDVYRAYANDSRRFRVGCCIFNEKYNSLTYEMQIEHYFSGQADEEGTKLVNNSKRLSQIIDEVLFEVQNASPTLVSYELHFFNCFMTVEYNYFFIL